MDNLVRIAKTDLLHQKRKSIVKSNQFIGTSKGILNIYVTSKMIQRALKFMDLIINEFKSKGYQINHKEYYGTIITIEGIELPIRLREKCKRIKKAMSSGVLPVPYLYLDIVTN